MLRTTTAAAVILSLVACSGGGTAPSAASVTSPSPTATAAVTPSAAATSASPSDHVAGTHASSTQPAPSPAAPAANEDANAVPSRVVIPGLEIDLPVISGDTVVEGNPPDYPLCDVAQYLTTYRYPGRLDTTTWIYSHARAGMFLPLLEASTIEDGASLVGQEVLVYSTEPRLYRYRIDRVERHAVTRALARDIPAGGRRLVLQTSEGPRGTVPKLQVGALLASTEPASADEALPAASPTVCYLP